ncbi:Shedu immune nuclease family protein [Kribbella sp. NPDC058693]|uniref:Shedu immune nuclease family protein n=1 Tax=Kribbella sp. NPDC058693 TaxID=3346602 RepID=UPI00365A9F87
MSDPFSDPDEPMSDAEFALARLTTRTYIGRSFPLRFDTSRDFGQPARYVNKVFDEEPLDLGEFEWEVVTLSESARTQVRLMLAREQGVVRQMMVQKVKTTRSVAKLETLLKLNRDQTSRFINTIKLLDQVRIEGDGRTVVDDDILRAVIEDPHGIEELYRQERGQLTELIQNDSSARDVIALAHRREELENFRMLLEEEDRFVAEAERVGGPEKVWQQFLERNPWVLGIGLAGQLLTSWDQERLEQVVAGHSVAGAGKRADGLLRTTGVIRSMVFAEIKHHRTPLLEGGPPYRSGCWAPSKELAGGVTQVQQTVYRAVQELSDTFADTDAEGGKLGTDTYLIRPRSFLIVGHLGQLLSSGGGVVPDKQRSFELYRRNLYEPEVLTFDELFARAEWLLSEAEDEAQ